MPPHPITSWDKRLSVPHLSPPEKWDCKALRVLSSQKLTYCDLFGWFLQETWYWHGNVFANKVVMSGVKCSGTELSLAHCRHDEEVTCPEGGVRFGAGVACSESKAS